MVFVESNQRRAAWLKSALETLGSASRVDVLCDRAENVARTALRGASDLVTPAVSLHPPDGRMRGPLLKLGLSCSSPSHPVPCRRVVRSRSGRTWVGPAADQVVDTGAVLRRLVVWWQLRHARRVIPSVGCLSSARCSEPCDLQPGPSEWLAFHGGPRWPSQLSIADGRSSALPTSGPLRSARGGRGQRLGGVPRSWP